MESNIIETGALKARLTLNKYAGGDGVLIKYKTAATFGGIAGASWLDYSVPFDSLGYVQVRVEAPGI